MGKEHLTRYELMSRIIDYAKTKNPKYLGLDEDEIRELAELYEPHEILFDWANRTIEVKPLNVLFDMKLGGE